MQIGKFTFKNRKWFYEDMQLANPFMIIWKLLLCAPRFMALVLFASLAAMFELDIDCFKKTIKYNM